jgi:hypothetical protein
MWNISDGFTTTNDFREGAGAMYGAGANVYKTADGKWDVTAGQRVLMTGATANAAGTAGECSAPAAGQQDHFWTGGGIWASNTANLTTTYTTEDDANTTAIITGAGGETAISTMESGAKHSRLFNKVSRTVLNTRKLINTVKRIWQAVANAWVSGANYSVGQVVTYTNGHTYICKLAHTSSSSIKPDNTTYWEDKSIGDMIYSLNSNYTNLIKVKHYAFLSSDAIANTFPLDLKTNSTVVIGVRVTNNRAGWAFVARCGVYLNHYNEYWALGSAGTLNGNFEFDVYYLTL